MRLRDHAGLIVGYYPYQLVLSVAAVWAMVRFLLARNDWIKTAHRGVHLSAAVAAGSGRPAEVSA